MSNNIPVLIVGAGPTGLMMACELARHGISFRIIDKKSEPTTGSNATWIQPGTLELLDHIGISDSFIRKGHICNAIHLHLKGKDLARIPLENIDSIYKYILMLPQKETEIILTEHLEDLGNQVERSLELIDIKQLPDSVTCTIKYPNNKTEEITSDWLIACDGANSTVREKCGIFFPGEDLSEQFMVADAHMDSFMLKNEIHVFFDKGIICGVFPMGHDNYRINANLHQDAPRMNFIDIEVKEIIAERTYGAYNISSVSWISPFWIHGRLVDDMRQGAIFFAGDAAHIHSPAGGQGMNSGLQDAYNLAWKMALVIKRQAKDTLLDSYQLERHPVIKKIVDQTEKLTKMTLFDKTFITKLNKFDERIKRSPIRFTKKITMELTQLDMKYEDSPIIDYDDKLNNDSPMQGEHAPNVTIDKETDFYDHLHNAQHNVLFFSGLKYDEKKLTKIEEIHKWLNRKFPNLIKAHIISLEKMKDVNNVILDVDAHIHNRYHIKGPAVYILRPDNIVAYRSKSLDYDEIGKFLELYLE